jgi:outer membrane protein assembly factor BamB
MRDGKPLAYSDPDGPSEVIATPVFLRGRVYASVGRDPDGSNGPGTLSCIDASKTGDITKGGAVWTFPKLKRSMSTVAVAGGILVAADAPGFVHALDAETGALFWTHDVKSSIWGSPLIADGKIYIGDKDGKLTIFALAREKKILAEISFSGDICSTVVAANGVLYVAAGSHLYAIRKPE